ncbi:MAG: hypothetical protein MI974_05105 [Chitinophagales bacterium]|nr:hypothetical protein [Chitinophagales bacterium]
MIDQLNKRLYELQQEHEKGQTQLEQLDLERKQLYETLLRISGAIQVLQEEINRMSGSVQSDAVEINE